MTPIIIESPYAGDTAKNLEYLREALRDSLSLNEAPFASHAIYPGALSDAVHDERLKGIAAGFTWWDHAKKVVFYIDLGWSEGMKQALARAVAFNKPFETRSIR